MHHFDRIQAESESLIPELMGDPRELSGEYEWPGEWDGATGRHHGDSPFSEHEELEMAAELLDVRNEQELDQFLGGIFNKIGSAIGRVVKSPIGHALGDALKSVAKTALPIAGSALGTFLGGPAGGVIGGKLASAAGNVFGLELEGLSGEDTEFEVVRRFVRFAGSAAEHAALARRRIHPRLAAPRRHDCRRPAARAGLLRRVGYHGRFPTVDVDRLYETFEDSPMTGEQAQDQTHAAGIGDTSRKVAAAAAGIGDTSRKVATAVAGIGDSSDVVPAGARRRGTWIRQGRQIILLEV